MAKEFVMRKLMRIATVFIITMATIEAIPAPSGRHVNSLISSDKSVEPSTHELLSSLGLKKLKVPAAHHRKRLAEQGRRHATGDSRMFVIKLPPNQNYYTYSDPMPAAARTLPLQMSSNGKPAKVYHWNIPVLHKLAKNRPQARLDDDIVNVEGTPTWTKGNKHHPNSIDSLAFYVPSKKTSFRKYFSGNGKPKSFYVLDKSSKKPSYHKII